MEIIGCYTCSTGPCPHVAALSLSACVISGAQDGLAVGRPHVILLPTVFGR